MTRKTVIITGASDGLGRALAVMLSESYDLALCGRKQEKMDETLALLDQSADVYQECFDMMDENAVAAFCDHVKAHFSHIDVLVNNAGIYRDGLVFRMSLEDWNAVLTTNLTAAFLLCRTAARLMIQKRAGSIINISSVVALRGNGGQTNYAASKAGLIGFTKSLAREVAGRGVRVNALAPGFIDTDMTEKLPEAAKARVLENIPLARAGKPEEVAAAALFLASDDSAYITGEIIKIDGGMGI